MKVQPDASPASAVANAPSAGPAKSFADTLLASARPGPRPGSRLGARPAKPASMAKTPATTLSSGTAKPTSARTSALPKPAAEKQPAKPSTVPDTKPRSVPAVAKPANPKVATVIAQMRMRAAAHVQRDVAESRTKSSRQLAASRSLDQVHATAHAASAKASSARQSERAEDQVRVGLFQAIERECAKPPSPHRGDRDADPARPAPPQPQDAAGRGQETPASSAAQPSEPTSEATQRAESVAALVERIEAALKDGLPTLSLGLADRSGASSVEISRTGKGEVAVRIAARHGKKPDLEAAGGQIKTALAARGLRLKSLSIA